MKIDGGGWRGQRDNPCSPREDGIVAVNPSLIGTKAKNGKNDKFLWVPPRGDRYVDFTESDWRALEAGQARL